MTKHTPGPLDYRSIAPTDQIYKHCPLCAGGLRNDHNSHGRIEPACASCGWRYHPSNQIGVLVVVEADDKGIVFVHPQTGTPDAPGSLPGGRVEYGETPEIAAHRVVVELTGLEIGPTEELVRFLQPGTPFGPMLDFGFRAQATGGKLRRDGDDGPALIHHLDALPRIIPIRAANQHVLNVYLTSRGRSSAE